MRWRVFRGTDVLYEGDSCVEAHARLTGNAELRVLLPDEDTWRAVDSLLWLVLVEGPGLHREPTLEEVTALLPQAGWRVETPEGARVLRVEPQPLREGWRLRVSCDAGTDWQHFGPLRSTRRVAEYDRRLWLAQAGLDEVEPRH